MRSSTSPASITGSGFGKEFGGSGGRLAFDEGDGVSADAEALKVGSGDVQIYLLADMNFADLVDHLRARGLHLVADLGHRRWLRGSGFLPGFGHDSAA